MSDFWGDDSDQIFFEHERPRRQAVDYAAGPARQRRLSERSAEVNRRSAILRRLTTGSGDEIAAVLRELREKRLRDEQRRRRPQGSRTSGLIRGRAFLVVETFVAGGGVREGSVVEIVGPVGDLSPYIRALEPENEFVRNDRRSFEILFFL